MRQTMLDHCPVSPYKEVAKIVKEDLGSMPEELFASFEHEPIASASLAQASPRLHLPTFLVPSTFWHATVDAEALKH